MGPWESPYNSRGVFFWRYGISPGGIKGQSSIEFLIIVSFMTLIFVSLFSLASGRLSEAKEGNSAQAAQDIALRVVNQIALVSEVSDGFASTFTIPQAVAGQTYTLDLIDGREVVVYYQNYEHVEFLPFNVSGNVTFGQNTIAKKGGRVYLNS